MTFLKNYFISFHQVDAAGILFFGHVFTLAHQAFEAFLIEKLQIPWHEWFQNPAWIVPIIQTQASYQYPLLAGSPCQIDLTVTDIRHSSFRIDYQFSQENKVSCQAYTVHVFCHKITQQKLEIPKIVRNALERHLIK